VLGGALLLILLAFVLRYALQRPVPQAPPDVGKEVAEVRIAVAQEEGNWKVEGLFLDRTEPTP
jgi:hypothetical protein